MGVTSQDDCKDEGGVIKTKLTVSFCVQSEAPLLVKPFLALMTKSELHAVMTAGFATIAGESLLIIDEQPKTSL